MSAKKAIRNFCKWCSKDSNLEIAQCPIKDCAIYPFRMGETIRGTSKQKAIRRKCEDCLQNKFTGKCKEKSCQLFEYREGKRPKTESSEEEILPKKKMLSAEHLKKMQDGRSKNPILAQNNNATATPIRIKRRIHAKV